MNPERTHFAEFPALAPECPAIDPADRKFIAVANAHPDKPPIVQATDSKWIGWREFLVKAGVTVEFIDEPFLQTQYRQKMAGGA